MIGLLRGVLSQKNAPLLLVDVGGVGYEVLAPMSTCYDLPAIGEVVQLLIHMVVREDAQQLYGFLQAKERQLFRALIKISGIGPKVALSILSSCSPDEFAHRVEQEDTAQMTRIPGIGKKTAERLIIELRNSIKEWHDGPVSITGHHTQQAIDDAISALVALGYKPHDANRAIKSIHTDGQTSDVLIRLALQQMSQ